MVQATLYTPDALVAISKGMWTDIFAPTKSSTS